MSGKIYKDDYQRRYKVAFDPKRGFGAHRRQPYGQKWTPMPNKVFCHSEQDAQAVLDAMAVNNGWREVAE
ncbi:hypothetical protein FACS1894205_2260 [Alphaproteobacteria bacterium]|nr:hypothetical protein FACS1894205_2260 [Alphaproteobacteria bacterium]